MHLPTNHFNAFATHDRSDLTRPSAASSITHTYCTPDRSRLFRRRWWRSSPCRPPPRACGSCGGTRRRRTWAPRPCPPRRTPWTPGTRPRRTRRWPPRGCAGTPGSAPPYYSSPSSPPCRSPPWNADLAEDPYIRWSEGARPWCLVMNWRRCWDLGWKEGEKKRALLLSQAAWRIADGAFYMGEGGLLASTS